MIESFKSNQEKNGVEKVTYVKIKNLPIQRYYGLVMGGQLLEVYTDCNTAERSRKMVVGREARIEEMFERTKHRAAKKLANLHKLECSDMLAWELSS